MKSLDLYIKESLDIQESLRLKRGLKMKHEDILDRDVYLDDVNQGKNSINDEKIVFASRDINEIIDYIHNIPTKEYKSYDIHLALVFDDSYKIKNTYGNLELIHTDKCPVLVNKLFRMNISKTSNHYSLLANTLNDYIMIMCKKQDHV